MSNLVALDNSQVSIEAVHRVITAGDLSQMSPDDQIRLYMEACRDLGLNWRTKPFILSKIGQGTTQLYLTADGADQLAALHNVSILKIEDHSTANACRITMTVGLPNGRQMMKMAGVSTSGLGGQALENARMKCETKAWRRAVRAIVGMNTYGPPAGETFFDPADMPSAEEIETLVMATPIDEDADVLDAQVTPLKPRDTTIVHVDYRDGRPAENIEVEVVKARPEKPIAEQVAESDLMRAKKALNNAGKLRGFKESIEFRALAAIMQYDLDVATVAELGEMSDQLARTPDALELVRSSDQYAALVAQEAAGTPT